MLYKNKFRICLTNNKDDEYILVLIQQTDKEITH